MVNARLLDRAGRFVDAKRLPCIVVLVQWRGVYYVATGKPWERANGTIDQDYAEQGVYCVSNKPQQ